MRTGRQPRGAKGADRNRVFTREQILADHDPFLSGCLYHSHGVVFSLAFVLSVRFRVNLVLVVENATRNDSTNTDSVMVKLRLLEADGW
jgi:hypothetical protein